MSLLWIVLALVLIFALALVATFMVAVRWGREWQELQKYGREVTGTVVEKRTVRSRGSQSTHIRYEYVDQFGKRHRSRRNLVTPEAWEAHTEGGPIEVIYSERHPRISAPKYLMDLRPRC